MILNAFHDNMKRVYFNLLPNLKNLFYKNIDFKYFIKVLKSIIYFLFPIYISPPSVLCARGFIV